MEILKLKKGIFYSGGIDSTSLTYWKKPDIAFFLNYGQVTATGELQAARKICDELNIKLEVINFDISLLGSGELANTNQIEIAPNPEWWPFRNQMIVTIGLMRAIKLDVSEIMFGCVSNDKSHKDGTKEFFEKLSDLVALQEGSIRISTPAINLSSLDLAKKSNIPLSLLCWSHSCTRADFACGRCNSCIKHQHVIETLINLNRTEYESKNLPVN